MATAKEPKLPAAAQELPPAARSIFIAAYNEAVKENDEQTAIRIAWAAVKRKFRLEGGKWQSMTKDQASDDIEIDMVDTMIMDQSPVLTSDGFLRAVPRIARTGIQLYAGHEVGDARPVVRVYRPEGEVFNVDALKSLAHKPVTLEHPPEFVNSTNWRQYAVGQLGGEVMRDGNFIRIPMMISDAAAVKAISEGKAQLSVGYAATLKEISGVTDSGEEYDYKQSSIRANHVALVKRGRGGPMLRIGDTDRRQPEQNRSRSMKLLTVKDVAIELDDAYHALLSSHIRDLEAAATKATTDAATVKTTQDAQIAQLTTQVATLDAASKTKDAEIVTLKQQLKDAAITPALLDSHVTARQKIVDGARRALGDAVVVDGKSSAEIMRQVVNAKVQAPEVKDWSDEQIKISFDTLVAQLPAAAQQQQQPNGGGITTMDDLAAAFRAQQSPGSPGTMDAVTTAYLQNSQRLTDAWKTKQ